MSVVVFTCLRYLLVDDVDIFKKILNLASVTHPILIFFDNLKIFFVDEHKNGGSWLPVPLPQHCKIVVTFQQEEECGELAR